MKRMKPNTVVEHIIQPTGRVKRLYRNLLNGELRKHWWTKARIPGTIRPSRMPGGSGYRGDRVWEGAYGG